MMLTAKEVPNSVTDIDADLNCPSHREDANIIRVEAEPTDIDDVEDGKDIEEGALPSTTARQDMNAGPDALVQQAPSIAAASDHTVVEASQAVQQPALRAPSPRASSRTSWSSPHHLFSQTTSGSRRSGPSVDPAQKCRELLSFTDPDICRGTDLSAVIRLAAWQFADSEPSELNYRLSRPVKRIHTFISHNWVVSRFLKFLVLALHFNLHIALVAEAALVAVAGVLPYSPQCGTTSQSGPPDHGPSMGSASAAGAGSGAPPPKPPPTVAPVGGQAPAGGSGGGSANSSTVVPSGGGHTAIGGSGGGGASGSTVVPFGGQAPAGGSGGGDAGGSTNGTAGPPPKPRSSTTTTTTSAPAARRLQGKPPPGPPKVTGPRFCSFPVGQFAAPVFVVFLLFSRDVAWLLWRHRGPTVFLDKICIHQTDADLQRAGIEALGAFLNHSSTMLVCYTDIYLRKLWTVYEVATCIALGGKVRLQVVPAVFPIIVVLTSATPYVALAVNKLLLLGLDVMLLVLVTTSVDYAVTVVLFRVWARQQQRAHDAISTFCFDDAQCFCEDDRAVVKSNIVVFMRACGFVAADATEAEALETFNEYVRRVVGPALEAAVGRVGLPYKYMLPRALVQISVLGASIRPGEFRTVVANTGRYFFGPFVVQPLVCALALVLTRRCIRLHRLAEVAYCIFVTGIAAGVSFTIHPGSGQAARYIYSPATKSDGALAGFLVLYGALTAATVAVYTQCCRRPPALSTPCEQAPGVVLEECN